jgi:hypothetical protein
MIDWIKGRLKAAHPPSLPRSIEVNRTFLPAGHLRLSHLAPIRDAPGRTRRLFLKVDYF